jgi:hypothetical protein
MPTMTDAVRAALGRYWPEVYGGAAARLSTQDLFQNIRDRATDLGLPSVGVSASVISTLRGYAAGMIRAADRLNAADPTSIVDSTMLSTPPWARSSVEQAAMPIYHIGFDHTIQDDSGNLVTVRQTIVLTGTLPSTVGELTGLVSSEAALLASESPGTSAGTPHGTSVDVGNLALMVV